VQPSERSLRLFFAGLALIHFAIGVWMAASPHSFFKTVGAFDLYSRHYERDAATFYLAFAVGSAVAVTRPRWRIPVLTITTVQYALHTINHGVDVGRAHNSWAGLFDVISLGLGSIQFAALLWLLVGRERAEARR
jgi:hypothetical protein